MISLGALDMVNFGPPRHGAGEVQGPPLLPAQPERHPDAHDARGERQARQGDRREGRAPRSGPTAILLPLRGVSAIDREGQPFWWPEADQALFQSIRNWVSPQVKLIELDLHINDSEFAQAASDTLLKML